jgi:3-oxoacyl-[acyl-carrier-protein] synthase-3
MRGMRIIGTGSYLPPKTLTNEYFEKIVNTSNEWIVKMTGVKTRHILEQNLASAFMCKEAGFEAIKASGIDPKEIDMVLVGTSTPDMFFPATACAVQKELGCKDNIPAFDFEIACSSFVYGLTIAYQFIQTGFCKKILFTTGDVMSRFLDFEDRSTAILFGDGASAVVLEGVEKQEDHFLGFDIGCNGYTPSEFLAIPGGGSLNPVTADNVHQNLATIKMNGGEIYRLAVKKMAESLLVACEKAGVKSSDLDYIIPHQANIRIMDSVVKQLGADRSKLINTLEQHANTSGSTVGIALDISVKEGKIKKGDLLGLTAFGAGVSWGSCIVRY